MLKGRMRVWGPEVFLDDAAVSLTITGPNEINYIQSASSLLIHLAPDSGWQLAINGDRKRQSRVLPGAIDVVDSNSKVSASWQRKMYGLRVDIDPARLMRVAGSELDSDSFELRPPEFGFVDKRAHTIALSIQRELQNPDAFSAEALDAYVTLCAIHMLRSHSSLTGRLARNGGLSPSVLRKVKEFVFENCSRTCTVEQLATLAGLSPGHFLRAFKQSTGHAPHQFITATRLALARKLILADEMPLSLIATSSGFSSHSHMTAQMKRAWGITPSTIRRNASA